MSNTLLRLLIRETIKELNYDASPAGEGEDDGKRKEYLITEPDLIPGDEEDEASVAGAVAGYTLPLGASNSPSNLEDRGRVAGKSFGGGKPVKKGKK